jgi:UDP-N-acetyl-D-mannosaminuronic acid dehydrogenase
MERNSLCLVGLGYIGLPTAAMFADAGLDVFGVDVDADIVTLLNEGKAHFTEPNLDALLRRMVEAGKLKASLEVQAADAFIIAVPTPFKNDHEPDLGYIAKATSAIAPVLKPGDLVILESTCPVGTTEQMCEWLSQARSDLTFPHTHGEKADVQVAHCPERVLPGNILEEVVNNARVVGGVTRRCTLAAVSLYKMVVKGECNVTNARTAEMAKLTENAFRDVNIAFANELSILCDGMQINVWELIKMANLHPRVNILTPGPGVGGHCIAVDPWFIVHSNPEQSGLISRARSVNDNKPDWVVEKVIAKTKLLKNPVVACMGLAYKPDVDDLRESPSIEIVKKLAKAGVGEILVAEPHVSELPEELKDSGIQLEDYDVALGKADIVVLLVDHEGFRYTDKSLLKDRIVIDVCGAW